MLHTATKPFIPNPDIWSGRRLYIIHPIPSHPFPLARMHIPNPVALPSHAHHHIPFCSLARIPLQHVHNYTAYLDFSSSLNLTTHRPLPFALRVEVGVGLFMHASKSNVLHRSRICTPLPKRIRKYDSFTLNFNVSFVL